MNAPTAQTFGFERALARVFPGWAQARVRARIEAEMTIRAYEMAGMGRGTRGWNAPGASASTEVQGALARLRNRSRDLVRSNPWAAHAARLLPAHMIGTGVTPRPKDGADVTRRRALAAWDAWAEEADQANGAGFAGMQALAARGVIEAGEMLLDWEPDATQPGGWRVRLMEPDYLDEGFNETSRNGSGQIVNGIEFDAQGRRVAYHLWQQHPGDGLGGALRSLSIQRVRKPAALVDHVFEPLRAGQTRGVPLLAASGLRLRDLDDYLEAERWRKKVAAAFAAFVRTPQGPAGSPLGALSAETQSTGPQAVERILPGTIKRLRPGEDVEFPTPPGDSGVQDYLRWELFAISAGIGIPYAELTGDLSNANYSSMRVGKLAFWAILDAWQWNMLAPMLLHRAWKRVQATSGVPGLRCEWSFPKRAWVDPLKDMQAEAMEVAYLMKSRQDAIGARGEDWRRNIDEEAEFRAYAAAKGVPVASEIKAAPAAAPTDAADDPADPADDAPANPATNL